jgi:hypothetical protein
VPVTFRRYQLGIYRETLSVICCRLVTVALLASRYQVQVCIIDQMHGQMRHLYFYYQCHGLGATASNLVCFISYVLNFFNDPGPLN